MKLTMAGKKRLEGYTFILPGFVYILIVLGYPLVYNVVLAFRNVNVKTFKSATDVFVGLKNFQELFSDRTFLLQKIYIGGSGSWLDFGCIYDANVSYSTSWKKYV